MAAAKRGCMLEVNTTRGQSDEAKLCPGLTVIRWWHELGGVAVSFGSDAHQPDQVGGGFKLATQIVGLVQQLRRAKLAKVPGVSETLDWAGALVALHASRLQPQIVQETLGCLIKDEGDLRKVRTEIEAGRLAVGSAA